MSDERWVKIDKDRGTTKWELAGTDYGVLRVVAPTDQLDVYDSWYTIRRPIIEINGLTLYHHGPKERFMKFADAQQHLIEFKNKVDEVMKVWNERGDK